MRYVDAGKQERSSDAETSAAGDSAGSKPPADQPKGEPYCRSLVTDLISTCSFRSAQEVFIYIRLGQ